MLSRAWRLMSLSTTNQGASLVSVWTISSSLALE